MQSDPSTAASSLIARGSTGLGGSVWAGTTQQDPSFALPSTPSHGVSGAHTRWLEGTYRVDHPGVHDQW